MAGADATSRTGPGLRKGRGATGNATGRYEAWRREAVDDGWGSLDEAPRRLATTLSVDRSRTVLSYNRSPDVPFDRSINPYRGCEHGFIYCYARPTHAWLGLSPGIDFESRLGFGHETSLGCGRFDPPAAASAQLAFI